MEAVITREGAISDLKALSGHALLQEAAMEAVRQWRYRPTLMSGDPVEVATTIDVAFRLTEPDPPPAAGTPAKEASAPPEKPVAAPAKSAPPPSPPAPAVPAAAPAKEASGPPSLYSEESKATLLVVANQVPENLELLVFEGENQLLRKLANTRTSLRDFSRTLKVLPGQRVLRVVFRVPNSTTETSKTERVRLNARGSYTLTVEMRGTDDNGLPRFNIRIR